MASGRKAQKIEAADKDQDDNEINLNYKEAEWKPINTVSEQVVKSWIIEQQHLPWLRIQGVTKGDNNEIRLNNRRNDKVRTRKQPPNWFSATKVPTEVFDKWAAKLNLSPTLAHDFGGEDILVIYDAAWNLLLASSDEEEPSQMPTVETRRGTDNEIDYIHDNEDTPSKPHFSPPATMHGTCDDTNKSLDNVTHTNQVAPCQSGKHHPLEPYYLCTGCHQRDLTYKLTKHEQNHMFRDRGLFSLCKT
ncbi:hypothetical protein AUEXF2481DRAFT_516217 [Aureobasidium subglaciale EXF-2481]|uniref:Uncharacterized protein n=1 Tax=Aureobasidium subglaciale (strain EXF-2481) TaxID=1043005 RepID=A0A074XZV6_AURSE|nr:uncharacterized protein AUEXF2481DRAFT_516217 [Aureobasidium subglaciale EXF-2481]KAI5197960.1 hypothetical protein E4T38_07736 [Aureobasidium subglaciale]KAI5216787.1 hypothetical protein E4T40_07746 [Aureobasidium subglaciale]KAI5220001.1 hypothetical protein E4T41_07661 [Aureobasidium subglaciale]KAI5257876.1 hypothetical protein E4T46_07637 [Aureobasidium subglaciale]KEQ91078.1 hypothetical protein AUEXF2481DRAFT_516217 [Aureobasidium subglaciale EXF-2481]